MALPHDAVERELALQLLGAKKVPFTTHPGGRLDTGQSLHFAEHGHIEPSQLLCCVQRGGG